MPYYMEESKLSDQTSQTREAGLLRGTNGEEAPLVWFSGSIQGMIYAQNCAGPQKRSAVWGRVESNKDKERTAIQMVTEIIDKKLMVEIAHVGKCC